jgi:hypothetical protein
MCLIGIVVKNNFFVNSFAKKNKKIAVGSHVVEKLWKNAMRFGDNTRLFYLKTL